MRFLTSINSSKMKISSIISLLCFLCSFSLLNAQNTSIPDTNLENYLETHAADGTDVTVGDAASMGDGIANNGLVFTDRIVDVTLLDVSGLEISNLTGIEDFTALETLICSENNLTVLNVSNNQNLITLLCGINDLSSLDVSANINLETLNCLDNQIQNLDVTNNTALKSLTTSSNQLSSIDISNNTDLMSLNISSNRIAGELIVSNNPDLESLFCSSNQISVLDLSVNTVLKNLDVSKNSLINLDLTTINTAVCPNPQTDPITLCQGVATINVSRNNLISLIVANGFNDLVSIFDASDNPDLFCIQIDNGFTPNGWFKDDWAYYTDGVCADIFTYVPDDNFEQALINQGLDDILDNFVLTSNIDTLTNLDVSNSNISNLEGVEDFEALTNLDINTNSIEDLDLSNNTALFDLNVSNNNLLSIDISTNTLLTILNAANNQISELDISNNVDLIYLDCSNNSLASLSIENTTLLEVLDCSFNQIENLDLTLNTSLTSIICNNNNLFALNLANGNNTAITIFNSINNTSLFCIEVDDDAFSDAATGWQKDVTTAYNLECGTYIPDDNFEQYLINQGIDTDGTLNNFVATTDINTLTNLDVSNLAIVDLTGIEDFTLLGDLNCSGNMLSVLNLENNAALSILDVSNNQIKTLNLTTNINLTSLLTNNNVLENLDIKNGSNNLLTTFDATNNPRLFCINVDDAIVTNIPTAWQIDTIASYNGDCNNNRFTGIPDTFFEQALIDLGLDTVIDSQVLTSNIEQIKILDVSDAGISDLTGIRDFKSLVELDCSGNFLDALDVSDMVFLERLNCSSNIINSFNTNGASSLVELFCAANNLTNLNISQLVNLEVLDCADNDISVLTISNNNLLKSLNCSNNDLTNLDISNNSALEDVNCNSNSINNLITSTTTNTTLKSLSCASNDLSDLDVNNYQGLVMLSCRSNTLNQLNISANVVLEVLDFTNNQITTINLNNTTNLVELSASQNNLSQLDLMSNTLLKNLNCSFNELTQLTLNSNTQLKFLSASNNELTVLDLASNTNLIEVDFSANQLSNLVLSNNLGTLKTLNTSNNQIEGELDLTTMAISACVFQSNQTDFCPETVTINVSNNLFDAVNIQNGINADVTSFNTTNNPNLDCIQIDNINTIGVSWRKDDFAEYSEDCNYGETFVPDDNFEQALIDLGLDVGPLNDYVLTINIEGITDLDVSKNAIADLTGIEDFIALQTLNVSDNNLLAIDVTENINLVDLNISNNQLTDVDVLNNTAIVVFNCSSNSISSLDLVNNVNLSNLDISSNIFTSFLPSDVPSLEVLNCANNQIVELDFQQNQQLTTIDCESNLLEVLNIKNGQNTILANLNAQNNPDLDCIETDNATVPAGATWLTDANAQFALDCFFGQTFVPDDNFEQALIDLGYDSLPLDDYVPTENIEGVTFLNIASAEISDLTGIDGFLNLTVLNFENNSVTVVDLSNNIKLTNLNASNNALSEIDLTLLLDLTSLNVSNNGLMQLDLNNNLNIIDLDVSNNQLSTLVVDALTGLEDLNCASNFLSSLNVTQNSNLRILFCQSNMFIVDQLNIQNGNNQNLEIFNATNNPDLGCILVDDPVLVVNNIDGTYDNWDKDDTASYQTICEDADNDGVPNEEDLCPGTEFGAPVDLFGCPFPGLANDNFAISILSETCQNSNNGQIRIVSQELYAYKATLTGNNFFQEYNFTNDVDILNLLAGTYEMCITIEEWPDYEVCYTIVITEPDSLEVFSTRMISQNRIALDMSGSVNYNIVFNGKMFTTHNPSLILDLKEGANTLKVSTDLDCQGVFEKIIFNTNEFVVSPNPFNTKVNINNTYKGEEITVKLFSIMGELLFNKVFIGQGETIPLKTDSLNNGIYIISIESEARVSTYKMIKQ